MSTDFAIAPEAPEHAEDVDRLNAVAFGPGRFAKAAYRLREGVDPVPELSFVAFEDGELRGSVRFWPVAIGDQPALMLGPLAVQQQHRGRGMGIALMETGIAEAKRRGWRVMILVGDEPYYARVGFSKAPKGRIVFPGPVDPDRILWLGLSDGALDTVSGLVRRAHLSRFQTAAGAATADI